MKFNKREKILLAVLVVVAAGVSIYSIYFLDLSPGTFTFMPTMHTAAPSEGGAAHTTTAKPGAVTGGPTTTKPNPGYSVQVQDKLEVITSNAAGVVVVTPVNTVASQANAILSITPPESKNGESLLFQKSTDAFPSTIQAVSSALNGTQNAFDKLRTAKDQDEYNPNNNVHPAHIYKVKNLTVAGVAAVQVRIKIDEVTPEMYLTWVRSGTTNWYINRTGLGITPEAQSSLDTIFNSIVLIRS